jgi:hypothetical protein
MISVFPFNFFVAVADIQRVGQLLDANAGNQMIFYFS